MRTMKGTFCSNCFPIPAPNRSFGLLILHPQCLPTPNPPFHLVSYRFNKRLSSGHCNLAPELFVSWGHMTKNSISITCRSIRVGTWRSREERCFTHSPVLPSTRLSDACSTHLSSFPFFSAYSICSHPCLH